MAAYSFDLDDVNAMTPADFIATFRDTAEASGWVAKEADIARPFATRDAMIAAFGNVIAEAEPERQMALFQAHPQLAVKATMTVDSAREQRGAGLDRLTPAEADHLTALNRAYVERFGFPFILAVRGANKDRVIAALEARLKNPPAAEFARALVEVQHIVRFRIEDRVAP